MSASLDTTVKTATAHVVDLVFQRGMMVAVCRCGTHLVSLPAEMAQQERANRLQAAFLSHITRAAILLFCCVAWSCIMSIDTRTEAQIPLPFQPIGGAASAVVAATQASSWPLPRQMALLRLRHSSMSIPVLAALMRGTARPGQRDYFDLMRSGYAIKRFDGTRGALILTPRGRRDADALARAWAKELRLHILVHGEDTFNCTGHCTCDERFSSRKSVTGSRNVASQFGQHLQQVERGDWKPFDHAGFMAQFEASLAERSGAPG
jgi:hypothetical protein